MNRKYFLSSLIITGATVSTFKGWSRSVNDELAYHKLKIPPYLKPGDTIGITSPASYMTIEEIHPAVQLMESWGFKVQIGSTIGIRDFELGGTDEQRTIDFQQMLDNPDIKAIMCARGGYGVIRIIDNLDFSKFRSNPKWIIGFSDITVLHAHINSNLNIATIHAKMCNSFPKDWTQALPIQIEAILSIKQVLSGQDVKYTAAYSSYNRIGKAEGIIVGGNLSIIETLAGSRSDLKTDGKILFLEETKEQLYSIDRMLWNLKRSGKLERLKGLIIGGFKIKEDAPGDEFGKTVYELIIEKVKAYDYPVCFDFPIGHQIDNFAIKSGAIHILNVDQNGSSVTSI